MIIATPAYPFDSSPKNIEKYTLKISTTFAKTYCNSIKTITSGASEILAYGTGVKI